MKHYHLEGLGFRLQGVSACDQLLAPIFAERDKELFVVALLDSKCGVLELLTFPGDEDSVEVSKGELFRQALHVGATGMIFAHNHPSGDNQPSRSDKLLTVALAAAGEALELCLVDHLIFGESEVFSFRQHGFL